MKTFDSQTKKKTRQNVGKKRNIYFPDGSIDESKLRFVIYARKSTEESNKQYFSTDRQIEECRKVARERGYKVVGIPIVEHASAKDSGNRPKFDDMLKGLENGEFEGIIAYSPDRLSRNMLEVGKILDLLVPHKNDTESILKKLVFASGSFTNDINGRLVLAVQFGLATQYSQALSKAVFDGMNKHAKEGKAQGNAKWGYLIDAKGDYIPDPKFFSTIQYGWRMILNGSSQKEVMEYWQMEDVHRMTKTDEGKDSERVGPPSKSTVSRIFQDPIYYGLLVWNNTETDLRAKSKDKFVPMVSKEEWDRVQFIIESQNGGKGRKSTAKDRFLPLRGFVRCAGCGRVMTVSVGGKKNAKHRLVYYRCQNKQCPYEKNEVRGYEIFDQLCKMLDNLKLSKDAYKQYEKAINDYRENELDNLRMRKNHLLGQKNYLVRKREKDSETVKKLAMSDDVAKSVFEDANATVEEDDYNIERAKNEIEEINRKLSGSEDLALSQQDFLNLIESAGKQMRNGNFVQKDAIARILLLNLKVDNEKRLIPIWNEAFEGLFSSRSFPSGDLGGIRTRDCLDENQESWTTRRRDRVRGKI